mmetsp:Transcript_19977/g.18967  ORF Transcript_19977/g.18967 Transcript_19977/m.18967 type:complete len:152 (-) Transcript_19977:97-552(-)
MIEHEIHDETCATDFDGFYELGLEQIIQAYLKHVNQRKIDLDLLLEQNHTLTQPELQGLFLDEATFTHILTFFQQVQAVLGELQHMSEQSVLNEVQRMFNYLLLIFIAFILLMLVLVVVALKLVITTFHDQIMQTQIGLKLIPGFEFVRLK